MPVCDDGDVRSTQCHSMGLLGNDCPNRCSIGCQHYVAHDVTCPHYSSRSPTHCFAVTAVQRELSAHRLAVIEPELKTSLVARVDSRTAFMPTLWTWLHRLACQQQALPMHDSVDLIQFDREALARLALTTQYAPGTSATVARQISNRLAQLAYQVFVVRAACRPAITPCAGRVRRAVAPKRATPWTSQTSFNGRTDVPRFQ